jgi:hypothetical protein
VNLSLRAIIALLALGPTGLAQAQGVAMVADLQGRATLQDAASSQPMYLTAEIPPAGVVHLEAEARLVLISLMDGETVMVQGPLSFRLDHQGHPVGPGRRFTRVPVDAPRLKDALRPGGLAQASLVMRAPDSQLEPLGPDPAVRDPRPRFAWSGPAGHRYRFVLKDAMGKEVLRQETDRPDLELPPGVRLAIGAAYVWRVDDLSPGAGQPFEAELQCLAESLGKTLDLLRSRREASFAQGLCYAAALTEAGLRTEARAEWKRLADLRPEDPILRAYAE